MGRKSYTIEEKIEILKKLRLNDGNVSKVSRETQIPSKCIRTWRDEEDKLLESSSKRTSRKIGAGRKPKFPQLELELKDWLTTERRENKRLISYNNLREKALQLSEQLGFTFDASDGWITSFMNRNGFSCRKITSIGQEDNFSTSERREIVTDYFQTLEYKMNEIEDACIFNMDETPIYIDMMNSRTISFKGEKNTEVHTTGYQKTKITVVITISLTGEMLRTFVILKGLKKVPKCHVPSNIQVAVSNSGMMDNFLMKQWITNVYNREGPFIKKKPNLLILDNYGSHKEESVLKKFEDCKIKTMFIPPRTTSYLQPLDVLINSIFKAKMKAEWQNWMINGACEYTPKGYRKRPSWEIVFGFISRSLLSITKDDIIKSFILSGINRNCSNLNTEIVNSKLAMVMRQEVIQTSPEEQSSEDLSN